MNKKLIIGSISLVILLISSYAIFHNPGKAETHNMKATVLSVGNDEITIQDNQNIIYTFKTSSIDAKVGSSITLEYTGLLDKNTQVQDVSITDYSLRVNTNDSIPSDWQDGGIFSAYYTLAYDKLKTLSLDEKIGQLLLVRYPDNNAKTDLKKYKFSGYIFFEKDFKNKTENGVKTMIKEVQDVANIPLLTAVDEEGGKIVRVSSNTNLVSTPFKSPSELYKSGGFDLIKKDTVNKSTILSNLGLNLNLAPVVDVSTDSGAYMYERTLKENTDKTSIYAETVIKASKGTGVSYTLKHFPGYGNNDDTHVNSASDNRPLDEIKTNDLPPFKAGIDAGAEAVLVNHNTVTNIDKDNPASLSASVHNLLRNDLGFTGIIMTDELSMGAVSGVNNAVVKAILAGNDLIITTDYVNDIKKIKSAIDDGTISENLIDKLAFRVIAWKYYKGLMFIGK